MAKGLELTWIASLRQWRKRRNVSGKRKDFYLGTGNGRDDWAGYQRALAKWKVIEAELDAAKAQTAVENAYAQWGEMLAARDLPDNRKPQVIAAPIPRLDGDELHPSMQRWMDGTARMGEDRPTAPPKVKDKSLDAYIDDYIAEQRERYEHGERFPDAPQHERISPARFIAYRWTALTLKQNWTGEALPKDEPGLEALRQMRACCFDKCVRRCVVVRRLSWHRWWHSCLLRELFYRVVVGQIPALHMNKLVIWVARLGQRSLSDLLSCLNPRPISARRSRDIVALARLGKTNIGDSVFRCQLRTVNGKRKDFYLGTGAGRGDRDSSDRALAKWKVIEAQLDAEQAAETLQRKYAEWGDLLAAREVADGVRNPAPSPLHALRVRGHELQPPRTSGPAVKPTRDALRAASSATC